MLLWYQIFQEFNTLLGVSLAGVKRGRREWIMDIEILLSERSHFAFEFELPTLLLL